KDFQSDPDKVWTLPTLIDATVKNGFDADRDVTSGVADRVAADRSASDNFYKETAFAERVAADELTRVASSVSALEVINNIVQFLDIIATPAKPELPALEVILVIANIIAGVAQLVEEYLDSEPQRLVSRAAIDPRHSGSSAAPYLSMIIKTALKALILLPAKQQPSAAK